MWAKQTDKYKNKSRAVNIVFILVPTKKKWNMSSKKKKKSISIKHISKIICEQGECEQALTPVWLRLR